MTRALGALGLVVLAAACNGGLDTQYGNPYPCDFAQAPGVRDQGCPSGWVCGPSNLCELYFDEGLPTDPVPTVPVFDQAQQSFPALMNLPIVNVAADTAQPGTFFALDADGGAFLLSGASVQPVSLAGLAGGLPVTVDTIVNFAMIDGGLYFKVDAGVDAGGDGTSLATLYEGPVGGTLHQVLDQTGTPISAGLLRVGARILENGNSSAGAYACRMQDRYPQRLLTTGSAEIDLLNLVSPEQEAFFSPDGGVVAYALDGGAPLESPPAFQDLRVPSRGRFETSNSSNVDLMAPMAVMTDGFYLLDTGQLFPTGAARDAGGGLDWTRLNPEDFNLGTTLTARYSDDYSVWALSVESGFQRGHVLSTWVVDPGAPLPSMVRLWPDCSPCPPTDNMRLPAPQSQPTPTVQVICASPATGLTMWQVVGSDVSTSQGRCSVESLNSPIDLYEITQQDIGTLADGGLAIGNLIFDETQGGVLTLGGEHGQVWTGSSLSGLLPLFLDRVPTTVGTLGGQLLAVSDNFYAVAGQGGMAVTNLSVASNGQVDSTYQIAAPVQGLDGWFVLNTGDIVFLSQGTLSFGPSLLDVNGAPQTGPFYAEADRTGAGIVISANDSLYFYSVDVSSLAQAPGQLGGLIPELAPQPGFAIRSMVLDQTLSPEVGGEGRLVVGYLLTSTGVFQFTWGGTPQQWTVLPLTAGQGEPVKVWMQSGTSSSGRVGYRDGTVFTLPHGFPFVGQLPPVDGGSPLALSFENLNNYPVALGTDGVYVATPPAGYQGGYVQLAWQPVARGVTNMPSAFTDGLLYRVDQGTAASTLYLFTDWGRVFQLSNAPNQ
jgi:hypothetical protein